MKKITSLFFLFLVVGMFCIITPWRDNKIQPVVKYIGEKNSVLSYRIDTSRINITTRTLSKWIDESKFQILKLSNGTHSFRNHSDSIEQLEERIISFYEENDLNEERVDAMLHGVLITSLEISADEQNIKKLMNQYPILEFEKASYD